MIEIKIPKFTNDGKPLKNEAGDVVYTTFHYDFELLGLNRKLMGIKFFELAEKQLENPPNNDYELSVLMQKQYEQRGWEAILMRKVDEGYELYNPNKTRLSEYEFDEIGKTSEQYSTLLEIKKDFFTKAPVRTNAGMKELLSIMKPLIELQGQLKQENVETPQLSEIFQAVAELTNSNS